MKKNKGVLKRWYDKRKMEVIFVYTITNDWQTVLKEDFEKDYYLKLMTYLSKEYKTNNIFPNESDIFNALNYTPYNNVKVVILGQDPYYGYGQAHGLSFSVRQDVALPPSLTNIFQELEEDTGCYIPNNGDLTNWAIQGVLLLNTVLTVRENKPNSHKGIGWELFTDTIIKKLSEREAPMVFILWGNEAQKKAKLITSNHYIITSPHPSPLSAYRGFFGSKPFSKTNNFLKKAGNEPIDWQISNI